MEKTNSEKKSEKLTPHKKSSEKAHFSSKNTNQSIEALLFSQKSNPFVDHVSLNDEGKSLFQENLETPQKNNTNSNFKNQMENQDSSKSKNLTQELSLNNNQPNQETSILRQKKEQNSSKETNIKDSEKKMTQATPQKTPQKPKKQGQIYSMELGQNDGPFLMKDINMSNGKSVNLLLNTEEKRRAAKEAANVLENAHPDKMDLNMVNKLFEDWEHMIAEKLGTKKKATSKIKLTETSKEDVEDGIKKENEDDEKNELNLTNVDERRKTKLSNIENITAELCFHQETVDNLRKDLKEMKEIIKILKKEIINLKVLINSLDDDQLKKQMIPFIKEYYGNNIKSLIKQELDDNFKLKKEMSQLIRDKNHLVLQIDWAEKKIKRDENFVGVYIYRHHQKK